MILLPSPCPRYQVGLRDDSDIGKGGGGAVYHRGDDENSRSSSVLAPTIQTARGIGLAKILEEVESIFLGALSCHQYS